MPEASCQYIAPEWRIVHGAYKNGHAAFEYRTKDAIGREAWVPIDRAPISRTVKVPEQFLMALAQFLLELPSDASETVMEVGARAEATPLERELLDRASATLLEGGWLSRAKEG